MGLIPMQNEQLVRNLFKELSHDIGDEIMIPFKTDESQSIVDFLYDPSEDFLIQVMRVLCAHISIPETRTWDQAYDILYELNVGKSYESCSGYYSDKDIMNGESWNASPKLRGRLTPDMARKISIIIYLSRRDYPDNLRSNLIVTVRNLIAYSRSV
jgi:hypothetical protein